MYSVFTMEESQSLFGSKKKSLENGTKPTITEEKYV